MIPALYRGLSVLDDLNNLESVSLEELHRKTGFPKASLLRILDTLIESGLAERNSTTKKYRARGRIIREEDEEARFSRELSTILKNLARDSHSTAEWYLLGESGCIMAEQHAPPSWEVRLNAGPGFMRVWDGEVDAVAAVGYAFSPHMDKGWSTTMWHYNDRGNKVSLSQLDFASFIEQCRTDRITKDLNLNANGVIRLACPLHHKGKVKGIISLAFTAGPRLEEQMGRGKELLRKLIDRSEDTL